MDKQRVVIVCPGRGTYNKEQLGYLSKRHQDRLNRLEFIERYRSGIDQPTVTELDGMDKFSIKMHTLGEHASPLIYACSMADYWSIDQEQHEVVAVVGNSMGWYTALSVAGALQNDDAIRLIDTMGSMMQTGVIGGQLIYPYVDDAWLPIAGRYDELLEQVDAINGKQECELYLSIDLGGYLVLAGNEPGMRAFEKQVPGIDNRFPMRLYNHAAFHTPMLDEVSERAFNMLGDLPFQKPVVPLVDGRGAKWMPHSTDSEALRNYTLGHQVNKPFLFNKSVEVAVKDFAPDQIIVLGPGNTLGSSVAHTLINHQLMGLTDKQSFKQVQSNSPVILSMGE